MGDRFRQETLNRCVDARNIRNIVLMRPINSMIEFKQIIGRGTRLYDGKDYFTILDFVKAHHHFNDPEWDGEPIEPETEEKKKPKIDGPPIDPGPPLEPRPRPQKIKIKLADGKARSIQDMMCTTYWHADGKPMSAQQFMQLLFGKLPEFLKMKRSCARCGARPTRAASFWKASRKKALAARNWRRCRRS